MTLFIVANPKTSSTGGASQELYFKKYYYMPDEKYVFEDAANEAEMLRRKVISGEAQTYTEAERQLEEGLLQTHERENNVARIETESRQVAEAKLQKLLGEDFKDYAIRFASIKEYEEILKKKQVSGGETFVPKLSKWVGFGRSHSRVLDYEFKHKKPLSFRDYLVNKGNGGSWRETVILQTYWEPATKSLRSHQELTDIMRYTHKKAKEEQGDEGAGSDEGIRVRTLQGFRENLLKRAPKEWHMGPMSFSTFLNELITLEDLTKNHTPDKIREKIATLTDALLKASSKEDCLNVFSQFKKVIDSVSMSVEDKELWDDILGLLKSDVDLGLFTAIGEGYRKILHDFVSDPEYILQKGNLRKVITALTMSHRRQKDQYQVALVFDSAAVTEEQSWKGASGFVESEKDEWRLLKSSKEDSHQAQEFLGVIVVVPSRELVEKIASLSSQAREFSHPVFDANGVVRYPKERVAE